MFTGLIETLGTVGSTQVQQDGRELVIVEPGLASELRLGESVAINGVCLTVIEVRADAFVFQAGPETLSRTNLGLLRPGDRVNLERSLRVGDRLGGHWVQGHVDAVGSVAQRRSQGEWETVWFACPPALTTQMVPKGSIAVDGVSLTLVEVETDRFSVALIPFTLQHTTLGFRRAGDHVNLETDILGKYAWKWWQGQVRSGKSTD
jgi:riboflavin synthase